MQVLHMAATVLQNSRKLAPVQLKGRSCDGRFCRSCSVESSPMQPHLLSLFSIQVQPMAVRAALCMCQPCLQHVARQSFLHIDLMRVLPDLACTGGAVIAMACLCNEPCNLISLFKVHLQPWRAGLLDVSAACLEPAQDASPKGPAAAALWQATLKDLSAVWPSLCQRLLARAVQDMAGVTFVSHSLCCMCERLDCFASPLLMDRIASAAPLWVMAACKASQLTGRTK